MPGKQRRRFPLLALLAVAVLAVGVLFAARQLELLPRSWEFWIDLDSAAVEVRFYSCGFRRGTERPDYPNLLARQYRKIVGPLPNDPEWVRVSRNRSWLHRESADPPSGHEDLLAAAVGMGALAEGMGMNDWGVSFTLGSEVCDALVLAFMELVHANDDRLIYYAYYSATVYRFDEVDGEITVKDIIPADTWLADPTPEHYYGPERIY